MHLGLHACMQLGLVCDRRKLINLSLAFLTALKDKDTHRVIEERK